MSAALDAAMTELFREVREIKDRSRRMETRLTRFLEVQGFDTKTRKPVWTFGEVAIPSMECSIKDILDAVPKDWNKDDDILITHQGAPIAFFYVYTNLKG